MTQLAKETGIIRDGLYKAYKAPLNAEGIAVPPPDWDDGDG